MKILHILNEIKFSGAEVMLKIAAPTFIKTGFDLHALSTGDAIGEYASILGTAGYRVHHISFKKSPKYFIALYRFLLKEEFDVVHIHPERAFFWHALVVWIAGTRRIVRTVHDVFLFSGFLQMKRRYQRFISRKVFRVSFTSISNSVLEIEKQYFRNPTVLVKNWVDASHFRPPTENKKLIAKKQFGFDASATVIISVGTCNEKKNHYAIFDAISMLNKSIEFPIEYLHRGTGPTQEDEKGYAKKIGVELYTKFVDYLDDIRIAYWASDIFVMSSMYEGLGNVILEAMNCGLPVVLYNVLGMRDTIAERKGGFLVEPNPPALAKAIKELILDEGLREQMGSEARDSVSRNFNMQESLEKLIKLYRHEPMV